MKYEWELRSTGRPFGPCEKLDDSDFTLYSRHTTASAARMARDRALAEMRRYCGPTGWDNHYAVFAVRDTAMHVNTECSVCLADLLINYTWPGGQRDPWRMGRIPESNWRECVACKQRRRGMTRDHLHADYLAHNDFERVTAAREAEYADAS